MTLKIYFNPLETLTLNLRKIITKGAENSNPIFIYKNNRLYLKEFLILNDLIKYLEKYKFAYGKNYMKFNWKSVILKKKLSWKNY